MWNATVKPSAQVHATAIIDQSAELGAEVEVGPYAVIGPNVVIGDRTRVASQVLIERDTVIGSDCVIHHGAAVGTDPQDLKYAGELTTLLIGDRTVIREYATLNRGTRAKGQTQIGSECLLMAYVHVAHDCEIGNHVVIANAVNMGGHVAIEDWAIIGGGSPIHQFVRIGCHAIVGGASRVHKDVAPYVRASGNPIKLYGLNTVGLQRRGFPEEVRMELKRAYRLLFQSSLNVRQAIEQARAELEPYPEVRRLLEFMSATERGVTV